MRQVLILLAALSLAACETMPDFLAQPGAARAASSASYQQPADQQLLDLERRLSATAQERGLGGALGSVIDPLDGFVVRAGQTYLGADAVAAGLAAPSNAGPIYWQPDRVHVSTGGDMGLTSGRFVQVMTGAEAIQGRYIAVWRRDATGEWKLLTETRLADPPAAGARR